MAMVVKNNMQAKRTLNELNRNEGNLKKAMKKLSTGMKINSAADDASGLSIAERMHVQMRSLDQDNSNVQNGSAMLRTAEGAVQSTVEVLTTLKEKAINAANDSNTDADRATIQKEFNQLIDQLDENADVRYNGQALLDGSKNHVVNEPGTKTYLANSHFRSDTDVYSPMTVMSDDSGASLGIQEDDTMTLSYVKDGKTYTKSLSPIGNSSLYDAMYELCSKESGSPDLAVNDDFSSYIGRDRVGNKVYTPDGMPALTLHATKAGVTEQISGVTVSFTRSDGTPNRSANTVFNDFQEVIRAEIPSGDNAIVIQSGTKSNQAVKMSLSDMRATALGLKSFDGSYLSISNQECANAAINVIDAALKKATDQITDIGATNSRLDFTSSNVVLSSNNVQASMSTIQDADMAAEMTQYTKYNVITQAAQSMLSQANQNSSAVLSLLQ